MKSEISPDITSHIVEKAKEFGASLAGIADVEAVKTSPSHLLYGKIDEYKTVGNIETGEVRTGQIVWPENAKSVIVIAVVHPKEEPELDWWRDGYNGGTHGNRILMTINANLSKWLEEEKRIQTTRLPYHIEHGGIFRIRLRAMLADIALEVTGPVDFDPCKGCDMPCQRVCPQKAFERNIYSEKQFGLSLLPARTGMYSRKLCNVQMERDDKKGEKIVVEGQDEPRKLVKYCRRCEMVCPVGNKEKRREYKKNA